MAHAKYILFIITFFIISLFDFNNTMQKARAIFFINSFLSVYYAF